MGQEKAFSYTFVFFGCNAYIHRPIETRLKLGPKFTRCVFVGYNLESKRYKLIVPKTRKLIVSWNVIFNEKLLVKMEQKRLHNEIKPNVQVLIQNYVSSPKMGGGHF
jgi:hypothetical protein